MDQSWNIRSKAIKLLEENIGINIGLRLVNGFLDMIQKVQVTKEKK